MKLSRLEIYGFKSFPQRTEIRFGGGITGIVGPNGSGKSNIADAVRWVLGEQSARALRGAKMEDVIFSGTQKRRLMPYCEVSLIFDNEDGALRNDHSEVMVTRRAYRTGEGEYRLNRKGCRLKDIVELFHDTGVGREGYSIIGQGHIDVILSGRGEERRAAFEEAAGIIGFRSRKEEAERKLVRTQENLSRVGDLLEELGSRIGPLKEQSEQAREYLALSARLRELDANIYLSRHERLGKHIASLEENNRGIAALIDGHERDIARCQTERRKIEEGLGLADRENDRAKSALESHEIRLREHLIQAERSGQALKKTEEDAARTAELLVTIRGEREELDAVLGQASQEGEQGGSLLARADEQLKLLEEAAQQEQAELTAAEAELETHRARMLSFANSQSNARERRARQQAMLTQAQARLEEVARSQALAGEAVTAAERRRQEAVAKLEKARAEHRALLDELARLENRMGEARAEAESAGREYSGAQSALHQGRARLSAMEEMSRAHEGYYQPVRQALLYARGNPRVHGVVAQIIRVPQELETAVEMVLGSALQHIVTEDEETAKDLIDFLREKRLGRTTFLPISAVSSRTLSPRERETLALPGCLGIASELVGFEPAYRRIIESLLGRTVIARDLDSAIAVSRAGRQAFNVVTLQGDVMRSGGAMTGGSSGKATVSLLGREREIKELAESTASEERRLETLSAQAKQAQEAAARSEKLAKEAALQAQDGEIGVAREEEQDKKAAGDLEQARKTLAQAEAAREQLTGMIADLSGDLDQAEQASREVDSDREKMEELDEALRKAFLRARDQAEGNRETLQAQREARQHLAHRLEMLQRDQARFQKEKDALLAREEKARRALDALREKAGTEKLALAQAEEKTKALTNLAQTLRQDAAKAEGARRELVSRQKTLMDESEAAHQRRDEDSQRLHKGELSKTRLEEELQAMAAQLWSSHELSYALAEELRFKDKFELPVLEREAGDKRKRIRDMGGINIHALEDYAATKTRYDELNAQRDDAEKAREDLLSLIKQLQGQMEKQFVRELAQLNEHFGETFRRLFSGGQASLSLSDPSRPLECDIQIKAQPPGKKLQLLSLLSGGERALTAIAILFAMLKLKPTPFCILDEIEAALDDANINSFADYLAEYARSTQFIVITHRKGTMERCDTLYGVAMREKGVSDMISVNLREYTA